MDIHEHDDHDHDGRAPVHLVLLVEVHSCVECGDGADDLPNFELVVECGSVGGQEELQPHVHHEEGESECKFHEGLFSGDEHVDTDDDDLANDVHELPVGPFVMETLVKEDEIAFESDVLKPLSIDEHPYDSK